ncbi:transferase [Anaerocolumna cellulosilytica]|uniref:Transferase n=1 Tax=Anaerocolumna cellulosilytica TaxID=433286 RepID=A0A6S6R502_9FIRM|nr:hypothetical protein [Anaerocolumna cellulosilytica]MBB5194876.1 GNAT superfamily N-acetyltransferase [Anaerocolumna cellulosilytica]BCJ94161.1 transferase [Anaerocolumna cellulosilytica]
MNYQIHGYDKDSKWISDIQRINDKSWPKFMQGENVMRSYWGFLLSSFHKYQHVLAIDDLIVAVVNSAPFKLGADIYKLHENGIYWGLKQISHNYYNEVEPDTLMALQIVVNPDFQGKKISYECLNLLKSLAYEQGFDKVVIPIRPSLKHLYPLMDMTEYIGLKDKDGFPYDPWLRVHMKAGGKIVKQCRGISIQASVSEWEEWTGLHFGFSGEYVVPGALKPVYVDLHKNLVTYSQDNVWVAHFVK